MGRPKKNRFDADGNAVVSEDGVKEKKGHTVALVLSDDQHARLLLETRGLFATSTLARQVLMAGLADGIVAQIIAGERNPDGSRRE